MDAEAAVGVFLSRCAPAIAVSTRRLCCRSELCSFANNFCRSSFHWTVEVCFSVADDDRGVSSEVAELTHAVMLHK